MDIVEYHRTLDIHLYMHAYIIYIDKFTGNTIPQKW